MRQEAGELSRDGCSPITIASVMHARGLPRATGSSVTMPGRRRCRPVPGGGDAYTDEREPRSRLQRCSACSASMADPWRTEVNSANYGFAGIILKLL